MASMSAIEARPIWLVREGCADPAAGVIPWGALSGRRAHRI
jgi:hypothetical protein